MVHLERHIIDIDHQGFGRIERTTFGHDIDKIKGTEAIDYTGNQNKHVCGGKQGHGDMTETLPATCPVNFSCFVILRRNTLQDPIVIPRLLLQPLVENSIIHGMEPSDREFMLEVSVDRIGHPIFGMLTVFTIADNGVGFDAKHLPDTKRIGIKNVADRLELFQDFSFFQIKSVPGSGTWVHIILPEQSSRPDQSSGGMNS